MLRLFVSNTGSAWRELNVGVNEDPYHLLDGEGRKVVNSDGSWASPHITILSAKWSAGNRLEGEYHSHTPFLIYPSPDEKFCVVVFRDSPTAPSPHNALVLNADGTVRHSVRQPARYAGQKTEFLYARWYECDIAQPQPPWWSFWLPPVPPVKEIRMMVLVGGQIGLPNRDFVALDFDPERGEFGDVIESGRF